MDGRGSRPYRADQVFGGGGICRDALRASMAPAERGPTENPNPRRVHGPGGAGPYRKSKPTARPRPRRSGALQKRISKPAPRPWPRRSGALQNIQPATCEVRLRGRVIDPALPEYRFEQKELRLAGWAQRISVLRQRVSRTRPRDMDRADESCRPADSSSLVRSAGGGNSEMLRAK
jgi:hypothetical protein